MVKYITLIIISSILLPDEGCTDLFALNYDSNATVDDNSCEYADHIIEAGNYYYSPDNISIELGESVQWNNLSGYHDVELTSGPVNVDIPPVSGPALIGSFTFTVPGIYEYECSIGSHANLGMIGTITVNNQCSEGFTYFEEIPQNTCIVFDDSNCFLTQDIEALQDISNTNNLNFEENPLNLGFQNWSNGRLTRLIVGNNSNGGNITLTELPESIGDLDGLVQLYIDDNELTELPESIGNLSSLLYLIANFNNLIALPDSLGDLSSLIWLDVGYNQIEYIPESIGSLGNLIYLWLFDNEISSVPESICNLGVDWNGYDVNFAPYFGIGGNLLCEDQNIPECVATSENFDIALDQFYYSFTVVHEQDCLDTAGDANLDGEINVLDVVTLVNYITGNLNLDDNAIDAADVNNDENIDVLDVVTLVNLILRR